MSHSASNYPVVQLLSGIIEESGLGEIGFLQSLGYRNLDRGLGRLNSWRTTGEGHGRILKQIFAVYPQRAGEWDRAVAATAELKAADGDAAFLEYCKTEQESFRPYIHVEGETTIPSSITMFGISGGKWNLIEIPLTVLSLPLADQLAALPELMRAYLGEHHGACPFFGRVTGFRFVHCLDYFQFDQDGQFTEHVHKPFRRGVAAASLN